MENPKDNIIRDSFETMDKMLVQSARRAGNIAAALYIVSNVLPDNEPLQKEIRKSALAILSFANDIAGVKGENYDRLTNEINREIRKVISYIEVGVTMYLISEMNFRVLRLELMALGGSYESRRSGIIDIETVLRENSKEQIQEKSASPVKTVENYKGHIKDIENKRTNDMVINVLNRPLAPTFGTKDFFKDKSTDLHDRKSKIINVLIGRPVSSIADIKADFPDVSFKTIQRDLQSLIDDGKIERVGERRWSMYKLL